MVKELILACALFYTNTGYDGRSFYSYPSETVCQADSSLKILVLPAYDKIANAGGSPDIQEILEEHIAKNSTLEVIPFPYKKLMGVPYQMVYDKRYCKPIIEKVDCDLIIMSQIITKNEIEPGIWPWSYRVKIYNVRTNKQVESIHEDNLKAADFSASIASKMKKLVDDILKSSKVGE